VLDHKNRRGHVLAVAGSPGKRGAGRLLAWASLRAGAGLVTLVGPCGDGEIAAPDPVMTASLDTGGDRTPAAIAARMIELARGKQAVAIGPGMDVTDTGRALVHAALTDVNAPLVLDADALNHLAGDAERIAACPAPVVITPHPGEAARLLGCTPAEVERDRLASARALADRTGAVVLLKGARTLVCDGRQARRDITVNPSGNPRLATAGSGDVLTGIIAALLAQGADAAAAARLGAYIHGRAGDRAAAALGPRSVTASDLADHLPSALAELDHPGGADMDPSVDPIGAPAE